MKTTTYLATDLLNSDPEGRQTAPAALRIEPGFSSSSHREELRHILLGSPEAIRQTIHQLHVLNYAETVLWSPVMPVGEQIILTTTQGEAISLLRRSL